MRATSRKSTTERDMLVCTVSYGMFQAIQLSYNTPLVIENILNIREQCAEEI